MITNKHTLSARGPEISALVAGFWRLRHWQLSDQALLKFIAQCVELGVTTVDHAMVYRSEAPFGAALALQPGLREHLQLVTKCGIRPPGFGPLGAEHTPHYDSSRAAIVASVEASLQALRTDYLDVLLIHRPDYLMDVHEVAEAFARLQQQGKVLHFGVSNFTPTQFAALQSVWAPGLVTNQVEFSPRHLSMLDSGVFEQCVQTGARPMLWSCLAGGRLLAPEDEPGRALLQTLWALAEEVGVDSPEAVVYAWVMALPCRPLPVLGTHRIERVAAALQALRVKLSREQWYRLWQAANGAPVP